MKKFLTLFIIAVSANVILTSTASGQIAQRGAATNGTTANSSLTITKPASVIPGDIMIVNIAQVGNNTTNPSLSGWILVAGADLAGGTARRGAVLYKIAGGSEPASYTFTLGAGVTSAAGSIVAFLGVDITGGVLVNGSPGGPFDVTPGSISVQPSQTGVSAAAITTSTANAAVIMFGQAANSAPTWSGWTTTSPGALTELYDNQSANASVGAAWATKAAAGSTGAGSATLSAAQRNGGILVALKRQTGPAARLSPSPFQNIAVGGTVSFTAVASNYTGSGNYTYTWAATGATIPGSNPNVIAASWDSKTLTFPVAGTYTVNVSIARTGSATLTTNTTTVNVFAAPSSPNLWATASDGTQIASFSVNGGIDFGPGPTNLFAATFPGTTTGGTSTAALGRSDKPSVANGYFYWLPNSSGNAGVVEVFGADATGAGPTRIGSLDLNGAGGNSLGFVRLGISGNGTAWILAGDGTTLYLAKFKPNGVTLNSSLPAADQLVVVDASVSLVGGTAATFQNGDLCIAGDGNIVALANSGGTTQIYTGAPSGASTTLTKKFDVLDENSAPFSGSVNGLAFDLQGSLYVSASDGLYYINQNTVNGPAATISISQVWTGNGLQDLASNVFPTTIITPVRLGDFKVTRQGNNALLSWNTLSEINSDRFEIERSYDGVNFVLAGQKQAAGNSTSDISYAYTDPIVVTSGIIYYRLKTVDLDGKSSFSKIVPLRLNNGLVKNFTVYPNPFSSDVKIELSSEKEAMVTVRISNSTGQSVVNRNTLLQKGDNVIVLSSELATLKAGMYVLEIISEDGKMSQKIIKR